MLKQFIYPNRIHNKFKDAKMQQSFFIQVFMKNIEETQNVDNAIPYVL